MKRITAASAVFLFAAVASGGSQAAKVADVLGAGEAWLLAQQESQVNVNELADEQQELAQDYRTVLREIEGLKAYNRQISRQIELQNDELATLASSISQATSVDRQILPLLIRMLGSLEQFIDLDMPFLEQERSERIAFIKEAIDRVDVTVPEKFRQVLDAYKIELQFGRDIEAYTDIITLNGADLEVDVLRLGRIGLYYQTIDGKESGMWNRDSNEWEPLDTEYRTAIRQAVKVARKLTAPGLLTLPLPSAKEAL